MREEAGIARLRGLIRTSIVHQTGVITATVTTPDARLAQQVAARLLELVNRFNLESRRSQATQERRFTERRLAEVRQDLRFAENRLLDFLRRNRNYHNSPELRFEHDRLSREVSMRQQLFTSLAEAFEQARIEEVRDTPVITVIEAANLPARPDARGLLRNGTLGCLVGLALGLLVAFVLEYFAKTGGRDAAEFEEFASLRRAAADDLRHPLRAMARAFTGRGARF